MSLKSISGAVLAWLVSVSLVGVPAVSAVPAMTSVNAPSDLRAAGPAAAGSRVGKAPRSGLRSRCATATDCRSRLDVPPGGPDLLYAPPPSAPQIENHDPRFRAPFEMVSATERYVDGEYLYTDYLHDDEQVYPDDPKYAGNAADLVEFRMATASDEMAFRFTFQTLLEEDTTIAVVAFDVDRDESTGSSSLPRDPGQPFPGTDAVLTTWGSGAEWSRWTDRGWVSERLAVRTDLRANQITVTVPDSVARPIGMQRATLAVGLHDVASGGWLETQTSAGGAATVPVSGPRIINLGFRFNETPNKRISPSAKQNAALAAGTPTSFAHDLDFDLLRSHGADDNVPLRGKIVRMYASRLRLGEGFPERTVRESQLVPYGVYVPSGYDPHRRQQTTVYLHGSGETYHTVFDLPAMTYFGEQRQTMLISPGARQTQGFYQGPMEADVFEAWNDAARHYTLDPRRSTITGYSMGGHGTYRIALLWPQLFARAAPLVAPPAKSVWSPGVTPNGGDRTLSNRWIENARNVPFFHIADTASELVPYPGQLQQMIGPAAPDLNSFEAMGYRYIFWSVAGMHGNVGTAHPEVRDFLGRHVIEPRPFHVTYARMPSSDYLDAGLVHDRAYWVSDIEVADPLVANARGVVDAVSHGFGLADAPSELSHGAGQIRNFGEVSTLPANDTPVLPYVSQTRAWADPLPRPRRNRLDLTLSNVGSLVVHLADARLHADRSLVVASDSTTRSRIRLVGPSGETTIIVDPGTTRQVLSPNDFERSGATAPRVRHTRSVPDDLRGRYLIERTRACTGRGGDSVAVKSDYAHHFVTDSVDDMVNLDLGGRQPVRYGSLESSRSELRFRLSHFNDANGVATSDYVLTFTGPASGRFTRTIHNPPDLDPICTGTFRFR